MPSAPREKVENGKTYILINGRWHLKDHDERNIAQQYGAKGPERVAPPQQVKRPPVFGSKDYIGKPWTYNSPLDYLKAYALKKPHTKAGKLLFNVINTATWMNTWNENRKNTNASKEQNQAIDDGFEEAMRNVYEWTDGVTPDEEDNLSSQHLNNLYQNVGYKRMQMKEQYPEYKDRTDPEALRFKAEYKVYNDMYRRLDSAVRERETKEKAREKEMDREAEESYTRENARREAEDKRFGDYIHQRMAQSDMQERRDSQSDSARSRAEQLRRLNEQRKKESDKKDIE